MSLVLITMADWPADRVMLSARLDADFIGGALHRDALIGSRLLGIGVRTQAQLAIGGDGFDATCMRVTGWWFGR